MRLSSVESVRKSTNTVLLWAPVLVPEDMNRPKIQVKSRIQITSNVPHVYPFPPLTKLQIHQSQKIEKPTTLEHIMDAKSHTFSPHGRGGNRHRQDTSDVIDVFQSSCC